MVLPFEGGVSPPLPVVSRLFSASYPQDRRSYYLFFNYLYGGSLYAENLGGWGFTICGECGGGGVHYMAGKTGLNHCHLWILNYALRGAPGCT